jgi:hypothetical protein
VAPSDVAPVDIVHPALFPSKPGAGALAAARAAEADEAARKADQARLAAGTAFREAAQATAPVRVAENLKHRAEAQLAAAETVLGFAIPAEAKARAERDKAQAVDRIAELQAQLDGAKAQLQPKLDAVTRTREAAVIAETARAAAAEAARQVARQSEPVSVLISRKTQRLYVRQAFEPILESPVTIQDADRPIGTHVFTAMERTNGDTDMRWSVVSLDGGRPHDGVVEPRAQARGGHGRDAEPMPIDPGSAKTALDRIVIPPDALDRIAGFAPRSSLIITDEALSSVFQLVKPVLFTLRSWHIAFASPRCTGSSPWTPNKLGKAVETEQRRTAVCAWLAMEPCRLNPPQLDSLGASARPELPF